MNWLQSENTIQTGSGRHRRRPAGPHLNSFSVQ
jgi:hypothetical protein